MRNDVLKFISSGATPPATGKSGRNYVVCSTPPAGKNYIK